MNVPQILPSCLIASSILGCASYPLGKIEFAANPVASIVVTGNHKFGERVVRITDPAEIRRITKLVQQVRRSLLFASVNLDPQRVQAIHLHLEGSPESSDVTMIGGMMLVPGIDHDLFYGESKPQTELWKLLSARLKQCEESTHR